MIFTQLSNASFRFSLRLLGAELEGGGGAVNCPPTATTCSAAEAASARVNGNKSPLTHLYMYYTDGRST